MPTTRRAAMPAAWPTDFHPALSPVASKFLCKHPAQAERVVADALEQAAASQPNASCEEEHFSAPSYRLPEALRRLVVQAEPGKDLLDISEAADRLGVSRPTVYAWIRAKRMLAWSITRAATVVPAEQILGPEKLVPGIDRVLEQIPDPRLAWDFLTQELPFFVGAARRPIDVLKAGDIEAVVRATRAYGEAFS